MERKDTIDAFGVAALMGFALLMALNQVVIKVTNDGFQPVFFAGIRSLGAVICIFAWMRFRGLSVAITRDVLPSGLLIGTIFALEFIFLFTALDLTTVTRSSVIFYSMPVWLAIAAHFLLPGEKLTVVKSVGLALAFAGVALAILDRGDQGSATLVGDLCALAAAACWAGIALVAKGTNLKKVRPEMQLLYQVAVSAPILLVASLFFGPFIRDLQPIHWWGLGFQIVFVVTFGFIFWLWLLSIYPAAGVASFSFLSPVFGVFLGWFLLGEDVGPSVLAALVLVATGIILINRPIRSRKTSA